MKRSDPLIATLVIAAITFATSCRLDDNLYDATKLKAYSLDKYGGDVDFRLDASYKIPDNLVTLTTLPSQASNEASPTKNICSLYRRH